MHIQHICVSVCVVYLHAGQPTSNMTYTSY